MEDLAEYRLLKRMGEGAAGEVWLATPKTEKDFGARPGDPLAIKIYNTKILKEKKQLDRIRDEFKTGSTIAHPNLLRIFDYPLDASEKPYLVMEYVDGITLGEWIHMFHPIPGQVVLRIARQLLAGLGCLHENGRIHRDLKPQNVMIKPDFSAKIGDFGVVKVLDQESSGGGNGGTPPGRILGSFRSSPPEVLNGGDSTVRSDLYSLGALFYTLLHGEELFSEEHQIVRLIDLARTDEPTFDEGLVSQDPIRARIGSITRRLLCKDPEQRPASASEIILELDGASETREDKAIDPLHGYVATALTGLTDQRAANIANFCKNIAETAKRHHLYIWQPRLKSDPVLHQELDPHTVYLLDRARVVAADVLILLTSDPSFGAGMEIEIASSYAKPLILVSPNDSRISRMVSGSFAKSLAQIEFNERQPEDLDRKLSRCLSDNISLIREWKEKFGSGPRINLGHQLRTLRERAGFEGPEHLAEAIDIPRSLIEAMETGEFDNPGVELLDYVCAALGVSFGELAASDGTKLHAVEDPSLKTLEQMARRHHWPADVYLDLRTDHLKTLAAKGQPARLTESDWQTRRDALERRTQDERPEPAQPTLLDE